MINKKTRAANVNVGDIKITNQDKDDRSSKEAVDKKL